MSGSNDQKKSVAGISFQDDLEETNLPYCLQRETWNPITLCWNRFKKKFQQQTYGFSKQKITVSIGLAMLRQGWDAEKILQKADEAMYQSKENGKNQITVFEQEKSSKPFEFTELGDLFPRC